MQINGTGLEHKAAEAEKYLAQHTDHGSAQEKAELPSAPGQQSGDVVKLSSSARGVAEDSAAGRALLQQIVQAASKAAPAKEGLEETARKAQEAGQAAQASMESEHLEAEAREVQAEPAVKNRMDEGQNAALQNPLPAVDEEAVPAGGNAQGSAWSVYNRKGMGLYGLASSHAPQSSGYQRQV